MFNSNNLLLNLYKYFLKRPLLLAKTAFHDDYDIAIMFFSSMIVLISFFGSISYLLETDMVLGDILIFCVICLLNLAIISQAFLTTIHCPFFNSQKDFEDNLKRIYENNKYFNLNINNLIEFLTELKLINSQEEVKRLFNSLNEEQFKMFKLRKTELDEENEELIEEIINKDEEEKESYLAGLFFIEETLNKYFEEKDNLKERINEIKTKQEKLIRQLNFKLAVERANSIKNS